MPGSPSTLPAPDLPPGNRLALVVSTTSYTDPAIRQLRAPARDAADLGDLLADPEVGGFTVTSLVDATAQEVRLAMEEFLSERRPGDLLLVYLSCHGLVDARRRLYFAATDTRKDRLAATGVEAQWLLDQFDDCRASQQVVILDCCFSGAFASRSKGDSDLGLGERFHGHGRGRVVLTASRASEYSFEGNPVPGSAMPGSVFTTALVAGIRSGAADADRDGLISVDDAYAYAFDQVRATDAGQTPQRWLYGAEGDILLARNPAGATITPAPLPDDLRAALQSPHPAIRIGAVSTVGEWLQAAEPERSLAARIALEEIAENDVTAVATAARRLLDAAAQAPPATPSPAPAPPPTSTAEAVDHPTTRRRAAVLVAAGLGVIAVVVAAVFLLAHHQETPTASSGSATSGVLTERAPWRLQVDGSDVGGGCRVVLKSGDGRTVFDRDELYGLDSFQLQVPGTFHWTASDAACLVFAHPGAGNDPIPGTLFQCCHGDTNAFETKQSVMAEVVDFQGSDNCTLEIRDAARGNVLDVRQVEKGGSHTGRLVTPGAAKAYLVDLGCDVRLSAG